MSTNKPVIQKVLLGYQPKDDVFPDDLNSFDVFSSLATGMAAYPDIQPHQWEEYDFSDGKEPIENPNFVDGVAQPQYITTLTLSSNYDAVETKLKSLLVQHAGAEYGNPEFVQRNDITVTDDTVTVVLGGENHNAVLGVATKLLEWASPEPTPSLTRIPINVTISMEVNDEAAFRKAARDRAVEDGLDEGSADAFLDPDIMSLDECGIMLIDPGTSPAGATIV